MLLNSGAIAAGIRISWYAVIYVQDVCIDYIYTCIYLIIYELCVCVCVFDFKRLVKNDKVTWCVCANVSLGDGCATFV